LIKGLFSKLHDKQQPYTETLTYEILMSDVEVTSPQTLSTTQRRQSRRLKNSFADSDAINKALRNCGYPVAQIPLPISEVQDSQAFKLLLDQRIDDRFNKWIQDKRGSIAEQAARRASQLQQIRENDENWRLYKALSREDKKRLGKPRRIMPYLSPPYRLLLIIL
jgi:hypothetical protein